MSQRSTLFKTSKLIVSEVNNICTEVIFLNDRDVLDFPRSSFHLFVYEIHNRIFGYREEKKGEMTEVMYAFSSSHVSK